MPTSALERRGQTSNFVSNNLCYHHDSLHHVPLTCDIETSHLMTIILVSVFQEPLRNETENRFPSLTVTHVFESALKKLNSEKKPKLL